MTHQQLVEEWKEKLQPYYRKYQNGHVQVAPGRIEEFLASAMLAAAKGAADAAEIEPAYPSYTDENDDSHESYNRAISKIQEQLRKYFEV